MDSINPYTGEIIFSNPSLNQEEINEIIEQVNDAFLDWKNITYKTRKQHLFRLANVLLQHKDIWANVITQEMGKPISQSIAEIEKCAWLCNYYSENGEKQLQSKYIKTEASESYVRYDPLGVILGVMPWNFPFWQVFRFAVPTLMAGNTVLLKHASNVQESAKCIEQAFVLAGFPQNVFRNLPIPSSRVQPIIQNKIVKGVSLTGSKPAGASVAAVAGAEIKPSLLELGGNNASVVFEDCDWETTLANVINARFLNTGQSCIAGKRLFVHKKIADQFIKDLVVKVKKLVVGNPLSKETFIGALVNEEAAIQLKGQLDKSVALGAQILCGGNYEKAFFEPTVVQNVTKNMPIYTEETFGPLLACSFFNNENELVDMINESDFGLGVSIFTKNKERQHRLIPKFMDGAVFINEMVKSDPRLPFGGTKISGYGRELSTEGILAFVNKKTVFVK